MSFKNLPHATKIKILQHQFKCAADKMMLIADDPALDMANCFNRIISIIGNKNNSLTQEELQQKNKMLCILHDSLKTVNIFLDKLIKEKVCSRMIVHAA